MRSQSLKKGILLTMIGLLALLGNFAHAHGGGHHAKPVHYKHVTHAYSHAQPVYVNKIYVYPKHHYHPATAYVPAEYHAHSGSYPLHRHYYWKQPHYAYKKAHHH